MMRPASTGKSYELFRSKADFSESVGLFVESGDPLNAIVMVNKYKETLSRSAKRIFDKGGNEIMPFMNYIKMHQVMDPINLPDDPSRSTLRNFLEAQIGIGGAFEEESEMRLKNMKSLCVLIPMIPVRSYFIYLLFLRTPDL